MKIVNRTGLIVFLAATSAKAFAPATHSGTVVVGNTQLSATLVTGMGGKPAASREEDLMLTLQVIMDHQARSTTVSKEQFIQQVEKAAAVEPVVEEVVDISVPYDAAARNAYAASDKKIPFEEFEVKYLAEAVALVKSKRPVDISVPYDATAKLAYEASDKSMPYDAFKVKYLADAVALVKSKQPVDLSIPYDATAKLAYEASDKSMAFPAFKTKYLADAVADVKSKRPVVVAATPPPSAPTRTADISVPYDAAAKLAYEASDKSVPYPDFKTKYEADAVADVIAKKKQ
jgi:hypothetical protein